jgi:hypothetical protein
MFSSEFFELLKQIVISWQVIAVTVGLVIYINIVNFVSRSYHHPRVKREKIKKPKKVKEEPVVKEEGFEEEDGDSGSSHSSNDELGLEEA